MKKNIFLILFLFLFSDFGLANDTVKVMCYNLLSYGFSADPRDTNYRKIIKAANPDILTIEEVVSQEGVDEFLDSVMNYYTPGLYNSGVYINGTDTDNGIFYKPSKFLFISNTPIIVPVTGARDMNVFRLKHLQTNREILIISLHLKSGSQIQYQQQRAQEVLALRQYTDSLPYGTSFIVQGDCNLQGATEQAYLNLTTIHSNLDGHCVDPLNLPGTWNENPAYAIYHTQSTRTRTFGGGSAGGLDDRFDLMLLSRTVNTNGGINYIPGSYTVFGNDGNHFNDSINRRPNTAVPDSIADALFFASDHLPVYSLFLFHNSSGIIKTDNNVPEMFNLFQNYPNPFNQSSIIKFQLSIKSFVSIRIFDINGREISTLVDERLSAGNYQISFSGNELGSGIYFYQMITEYSIETKKFILLK
jgi:hypothetical protein